jgi:hypothetical protein
MAVAATAWSNSMKMVVAVVSLALLASLANQVTAAQPRNKKRAHRQHAITKPSSRPSQGGGDYYEHLLNKVPFGSQKWWTIYNEQHGEPN